MKRRVLPILQMFAASLILVAQAPAQQPAQWALQADIAESCSCDPACPCMFGSPMTNETCEGSRLYEIKKGEFGGVTLDGLKVIATFSVGKWVKYYVSEDATDEQLKAVPSLISNASPVFDVKVLSVEKGKISIERSPTRMKFAGPASSVEIEQMTGLDGNPVKIENLPFEDLVDYVQYKSVKNTHESDDANFEYSGTNGFTSRVDKKG